MIITRTPFRVSLFGGGSDYPSWIRDHGGRVLGFAIDKYCYISVRELPPFFEYKHRIVHSKIELVNVADEIQHPAIRGVLNCFPPDGGIEIHHAGDLPARSGLGSSSSFSVGMINAIQTLSGICLDHKQLACEAMHLEQDVLREHVGCQDQIWAAHGGFNRIDFAKDGAYTLKPLSHQTETLSHLTNHLMLFFSGFSRFASKIAERLIANLSNREAHILRMMDMVDDAEAILDAANPELSDIGRLLDESWWLKRELADEVSTSAIDDIYAAAPRRRGRWRQGSRRRWRRLYRLLRGT